MPFYQIMLTWASQYEACAIDDIPLEAAKQLPDRWGLKQQVVRAAAKCGVVGIRFQNGGLAGYASGSYLSLSDEYALEAIIHFDGLMRWWENGQAPEPVFNVCLAEVL